VGQILVDCDQFFIIHFSNGTPRHLFAEFMAAGIGEYALYDEVQEDFSTFYRAINEDDESGRVP
jgi:hypothetical protein